MPRRHERLGEFEAIELLRGLFDGPAKSVAAVGIGDDAAVLRWRKESVVWTVDANVEGVHFEREWLSLSDVGWRSFQAAVSDLAAMGARPVAALSSLVLPAGFQSRQLRQLGVGQADAARAWRCPVLGGNIAKGTALSVTTTVLGEAEKALLRSGACTGDELWLVGEIGLATAGWQSLKRVGPNRARAWSARRSVLARALVRCLQAWRRPVALLHRGRQLVGRASAVIDVSDGLAGDAGKLAAASGTRVIIETDALERVILPELRVVAQWLGTSARELALAGGEDYALLACGPPKRRPRWARRIGRIEAGAGAALEGHRVVTALEAGFDHLLEG